MPPASLSAKSQISTLVKRFKFEELESAVFPIFPELSWSNIKLKLVKNHENLSTVNALRYMEEEIRKAKLKDGDLQDRLANLEAIDVSRHYYKKVWYGNELKGKDAPSSLTLPEIEGRIKDSFNVYHMEMVVRAAQHKGIIFLSIKERPKKRPKTRSRKFLPLFFAIVKNETFFFCSRRVIMKNIVEAVVNGLGYKSSKVIKFSGKHIPSLVEMLIARKNAILEGDIVKPPLPFKRDSPVKTPLGLDFTQHKQREEYVDKCFGEKPPIIEVLKVKSLDQKWKHEDARQKLPNDNIFTGIEFRSTNIPNFLKNLAAKRILNTPLPCYAANILKLARNDITLKVMDQNQDENS